jgi:hypothetical protein
LSKNRLIQNIFIQTTIPQHKMPDASRRQVIDDLFSERAVSGTELITALLSDAVGLIRPPGNTRAAAVVAYDNQPKGIAILASTREGLEGRLPKTFPSRAREVRVYYGHGSDDYVTFTNQGGRYQLSQ